MTAPTPEWSAAALALECVDAWLDTPGEGDILRLRSIRSRIGVGLIASDGPRLVSAITALAERAYSRGLVDRSTPDDYERGYAAGKRAERAKAVNLCLHPYGDEVAAMAGDEPFAVGKKIIRALQAPQAPDDRRK